MSLLKLSTARSKAILMVDSTDHVTGKTGLTLTITASKDCGAFATITPTVTELADGFYALALTTTHTNTLGDLALHITATGADPTDVTWQVVTDLPGVAQTGDTYAVVVPTGNAGKSIGILWAGTLSAISDTSITLPGGHNLDHEGNYAVVLNSGTHAQGKAHYLTYSGSGEVWTVDPAWNDNGETTPSGTITASIVSAPKLPTAGIPSVNTTKIGGTTQTAADLGTKAGYALSATGLDPVFDAANGIETGLSLRGSIRLIAAVIAGKISISGSTYTYRNAVADSKARVTATASAGARTAITTDQT